MIRLTLAEAKRLGLRIAAATPAANTSPVRRKGRGQMPEDILWEAVRADYPQACREYAGAVPGRRYRIDVALVEDKVAIECDGWQYHGKHRSAHETDRERQNQLAVAGWMILRFTARQIFKDIAAVKATVGAAVEQRRVGT